jgi:hypothetical protein
VAERSSRLNSSAARDYSSIKACDDYILRRVIYPIINEGFKLLGDGGIISNRPGDVDIALVYGYSWPACKGGPLFFADRVIGLPTFLRELELMHKELTIAGDSETTALASEEDGDNDALHLRLKSMLDYFKPAPLLCRLVAMNVSVLDIQANPNLVERLMQMDREDASGPITSKL